ncbi:alpha-beta hydrolase superfamily lysophospholipase [Bacillus pakistanensis]|uniref:Alpha-beta hydrolase superfamily lysophospholipase n=1 Tax=Rossellomorea pakistanensis TaxID=992288 RepID=A0ABS2NH23_9BACI|nr:alpha/beta hydrolase [Bacillus pakistanensis]MBM7587135.1 alpha-beta hydrolase superfamily lysophospholipase [Bacillus pakistanensis]
MEKVLERLSRWEKPVSFHTPVKKTSDIEAYLDYYGFNLEGIDFHFGKVDIDGTKIMVQIFSPKERKGTVFLLHGYLDHVGSLKNMIQSLIKHHYCVISYDLQGHGLSGGEAASVNDFSKYVLVLEKLMQRARDEMSSPFYIIGHSTGGAIAINYVLKHHDHHFNKMVLVAPLIRSSYWHLTKVGLFLTKPVPFIDDIGRNFRQNSSSKNYLSFTKNDPLQPKAIPLRWVEALIKWNKEIQSYSPTNTTTCMIQGDKDKTVDWEYNLAFIQDKFPCLKVVPIKNGRHALFNEGKNIREEVFTKIHQFLKEN